MALSGKYDIKLGWVAADDAARIFVLVGFSSLDARWLLISRGDSLAISLDSDAKEVWSSGVV